METVFKGGLKEAAEVRDTLKRASIYASVNGCSKNGYECLVAAGKLALARTVLEKGK